MRISDWISDVCSSDLLVTSSEGTDDRYELTAIDLTSARMVKRVIVRGLENHWSLAGNLGSIFYFVTDSGAPRRRIVTMDVASMTRQLREIVPQSEDVLEGAAIIGGVLFAHRSEEHTSELQSLMRTSYAVFCLKKKTQNNTD